MWKKEIYLVWGLWKMISSFYSHNIKTTSLHAGGEKNVYINPSHIRGRLHCINAALQDAPVIFLPYKCNYVSKQPMEIATHRNCDCDFDSWSDIEIKLQLPLFSLSSIKQRTTILTTTICPVVLLCPILIVLVLMMNSFSTTIWTGLSQRTPRQMAIRFAGWLRCILHI